jgi:PAS domain S-box-containing protein
MTAMKDDETETNETQDQHTVNEPFAFYKLIVDSVPSAVITVGQDLKITGFNPWAEKVTGYEAKEAIGRYCKDILQGGICDTRCPLKIALRGHEPISLMESTVRTKSGETISVRMNVAGLFDENGDLIGGVESFEDVSALKALERERNNLISTLAHDMKSSLSIIGGFVLRLLQKSNSLDRQKEQRYLEIIRDESGKLDMLISDFLDFARLQTGRLRLNLNATSLDKELMELCELYQPKISVIGLKLELENEHALPPIMGDTRQLRRVFTNLFDNAIKFSQEGGKIVISTANVGNDVLVKVTDQGTGISKADLPYIFDAFHLGTVGAKVEGFGLGLAAVKAIIEAHGGKVMVESKINKGSTFTVILPRRANKTRSISAIQ